MTTKAKVRLALTTLLALGLVRVAAGGPPAGVKVEKLALPSYPSARVAPSFSIFLKNGKMPKHGEDYMTCEEVTGAPCKTLSFSVTFNPQLPKCPLQVVTAVRNCLKEEDDPGSCAAVQPHEYIIFKGGTSDYQVRFSPFGAAILVKSGQDTAPLPIYKGTASAWYKFTVDSPIVKCDPVDPTVIVTN